MKNLAPELLHEIYTLACTDGGFTGCSLSLVSQSIKATSRSARFHSVALSGTSKQMAAFLSCFNKERATPGYEPTVKHLFFSAAEGGDALDDWHCELNSRGSRMRDVDPIETARRARVEAQSTQYRQDVAAFFRLVSRDLQTLSFVHSNGWHAFINLPDIVCPDGFPALREFYLYGKNPFFDAAGSPIRFPHLTHLRLPFYIYCRDGVFGDWADRAPNVTHLCVSDVTKVYAKLEDIAIWDGPFKKLGSLYLIPRSPPSSGGCSANPYIAYGEFKRDFDNFLAASVRPIKVLPHRDDDDSPEKSAAAEWLDRVGGGVGCWSAIEPRPADWVPAERKKVSHKD
ncbi:hypothetical protein K466DRAFT_580803 [Polyporus arcularius HHB13444]|uniref:F-box domain-containing protein n=1 Tax=Polyporus arcularius HHB13444 TaxID=1314778 RepID=A0A5C3PVF7_9APHY|nr:hypothetical protein K466DRAFT_580803 [Polyporus arcularius HHB13444]